VTLTFDLPKSGSG